MAEEKYRTLTETDKEKIKKAVDNIRKNMNLKTVPRELSEVLVTLALERHNYHANEFVGTFLHPDTKNPSEAVIKNAFIALQSLGTVYAMQPGKEKFANLLKDINIENINREFVAMKDIGRQAVADGLTEEVVNSCVDEFLSHRDAIDNTITSLLRKSDEEIGTRLSPGGKARMDIDIRQKSIDMLKDECRREVAAIEWRREQKRREKERNRAKQGHKGKNSKRSYAERY